MRASRSISVGAMYMACHVPPKCNWVIRMGLINLQVRCCTNRHSALIYYGRHRRDHAAQKVTIVISCAGRTLEPSSFCDACMLTNPQNVSD
jgi:hypothetical protein